MKKAFSLCLLALALPVGAQSYLERIDSYIENTAVFEENQEPGRAFHIPAQSLSLNGTWKFGYYESPSEVPADFFKPAFNDRKWGTIEVPSNWEMQGYGQAVFRNVSAPFYIVPPEEIRNRFRRRFQEDAPPFAVQFPKAPEFNPTGAYRTTFNLPRDWKGEQVFLRFEKVASASFVWINGQEVGYNEGAQEPAEYNVTKYLKPGKNTLAVLVLKYCDGYYLEGQDYWRLAGIFDDVTLYASPQARIWDWQVITDFGPDFVDSDLSVAVTLRGFDVQGSGYRVKATVSKDGKNVAEMSGGPVAIGPGSFQTVNLAAKVKAPEKWTAETPSLYRMDLVLTDAAGKVVDQVDKRIGFKKTEIRDGVFYLNGQPVKVSAQCSHMQHPTLGHAMTEEVVRRDMEILKQFNFNGVRTSHYPPVNEYLDLADEYGLYIIDETGDEAHASEYASSLPEFKEMYRERVRRMVLRDRNHACVLFWSAGNESGEGENIAEVIQEGKSLDPTRYWMYGGNAPKHPAEDIVGPRYPIPLELELGYGLDTQDMRPSFMDEYVSVAGNGGGCFDDFWEVVYAYPKLMGGAVWDFVSPGLTERVRTLKDQSPNAVPAHLMGRAKLVKGRTGKAVDLNKQDQWVQLYRADALEIAGEGLTLTLDILPRKYNVSGGYLLTKGDNQFGLRQWRNERLDFYLDNGQKQVLSAPLPADWEGSWHNVTATYDGKEMRIYLDGALAASQPMTGAIRNLPLSVCIGRSEDGCGQDTNVFTCDALIDNAGVFAEAVAPGVFDPSKAAVWLDFEEEMDEGTFWTYGLGARTYGSIWPDRTPQPEMWQMKKSAQPLSFRLLDADQGTVEVWNRSRFLNASHYVTTWTLTADADVVASGELPLDIAPMDRKIVRIQLPHPQTIPGKEYRLTVSSVLAKDEMWAPKGHEVSWDQFELKAWNIAEVHQAVSGKAGLSEKNASYVVSGEDFSYAFSAVTGELVSAVVRGKEMMAQPLKLNVWRAPIANEADGWGGSSAGRVNAPGYSAIGQTSQILAAHYYAAGLDRMASHPIQVTAREAGNDVVVEVRTLALLGSEDKQLDAYISGRSYSGFEESYRWIVAGDGTLTLHHKVNPQGSMPAWLPRMGLTLMLDKSLDQVEWHGRGPQASYPDRKSGYRLGIWQTDVASMYEPYLMPQDYGLRTDTRWVRMTDASGCGLEFSMDQPFAFNAYDCTTDNLTKAVYQFDLQRGGDITLNLDYATSGVGDTARGILGAYRAYPTVYERTIRIRPVK